MGISIIFKKCTILFLSARHQLTLKRDKSSSHIVIRGLEQTVFLSPYICSTKSSVNFNYNRYKILMRFLSTEETIKKKEDPRKERKWNGDRTHKRNFKC